MLKSCCFSLLAAALFTLIPSVMSQGQSGSSNPPPAPSQPAQTGNGPSPSQPNAVLRVTTRLVLVDVVAIVETRESIDSSWFLWEPCAGGSAF